MALTPETLPRHELNGLRVAVVDAANPDLVGIAGRVVLESKSTLHVEDVRDGESRVRQVPKESAVFEFAITDEAADCAKQSGTTSKPGRDTAGVRAGQSGSGDGVAYVTVDGDRLLSRPALRTETAGDSKWR
jgi:ribonuclease P protein subunit POP4